MSKMTLEKAASICKDVALERIRWGRHAGRAGHRQEDVLDALVVAHENGLFEHIGAHEERVKANRQRAAAEARATKSQKRSEKLQEDVDKLEAKVADLKAQLADSPTKKSFFGK